MSIAIDFRSRLDFGVAAYTSEWLGKVYTDPIKGYLLRMLKISWEN
jgi:hypothetical protein